MKLSKKTEEGKEAGCADKQGEVHTRQGNSQDQGPKIEERAWCIQGRGRQPVWLQQSEPEERVDEGRQIMGVKATRSLERHWLLFW